jgi:sarcosine oxidase
VRLNAKRNRCRPCAAPTVAVLRRPPQAGKIADDTRGPLIDPSTMERVVSEEKLSAARAYLRMRFPAMAGSSLLESRVCQYENSTDHNFILDRHPEAENAWIVGGGSGHGFKHGPAIDEIVADAVLGSKAPPTEMGFGRLLSVAPIG